MWPFNTDYFDQQFDAVNTRLDKIEKGIKNMAIDQATFDTDLAALVSAVTNLDNAMDAWISAHPDLTAEDQSVQSAAAAVSAELAKLNPSPAPAPTPPASPTTPPAPTP